MAKNMSHWRGRVHKITQKVSRVVSLDLFCYDLNWPKDPSRFLKPRILSLDWLRDKENWDLNFVNYALRRQFHQSYDKIDSKMKKTVNVEPSIILLPIFFAT